MIPERKPDESYAESRQNGTRALRHFYASALLEAGKHIKALAEYPGHSDPGLTPRVYAHLMPSSQERSRAALRRSSFIGEDNAVIGDRYCRTRMSSGVGVL
ncbi:hypothetical protein ACIBBD_27100 [Streptomyces sp. NPDC051315]|uniref:hypothetical protein n=1 Tax=Streptomyces sp. NPDC051315 TaxID=3365650 RepID=UPI0037B33931